MKKLLGILLAVLVLVCAGSFAFSQKTEYATEENGWNLMLVNDKYHVPQNYAVELVKLDGGERVDKRVHASLEKMMGAAEEEGIHMVVAEGYRTREEQQKLMDERTEEYQQKILVKFVARNMASRWVAKPGTSEHQLGLAVDLNADGIQSTGNEVYDWLSAHAYEYGFIQRYPEDKTKITGISYEPWHYRYVGKEAATQIHERNICLEEYIETLDK